VSPWRGSVEQIQCEATVEIYRRRVVELESKLNECQTEAKVAESPEMAHIEDVTAESGPHAALAEARKILIEAWEVREKARVASNDARIKMDIALKMEQEARDQQREAQKIREQAEQSMKRTALARERHERWLHVCFFVASLLTLVTAAQIAMLDWQRIIDWF
jgi:hypothetical protein